MCYERRRAEACVDVGPVRNPVLLHRVAPCFPWFLSFGNRTQNSRVAGARPNHQPIGWDRTQNSRVAGVRPNHQPMRVCVLLLQDLLQSCARGGRRRVEDMCYERRCFIDGVTMAEK